MSHVSTIEYPTRAALVAALADIQAAEGVEQVDIIGLGRTLRVVTTGDAPLEALEATETPAEPQVPTPAAPAATEASETPTETAVEPAEEDLIGEAPSAPKKGRR